MSFFGIFFLCLIALFAFTAIGGVWGIILLAAALIAALIRGLISISDRLDRIEQALGITSPEEEQPKTFTEQTKASEDAEKPAP